MTATILTVGVVSANDWSWKRWDEYKQRKSNHVGLKDDLASKRIEIKDNWESFHDEQGRLSDYLKDGLTDAEKQTIDKLLSDHKVDVKTKTEAFITTYSGSGGPTTGQISSFVTSLVNLKTNLYADLEIYVDTGQMDEYDSYVEGLLNEFAANFTMRITYFKEHKGMSDMHKMKGKFHLPERIRDRVRVLIDILDNDVDYGKKADFLQSILDKIAKKMDQIENTDSLDDTIKEKLISFLGEIYDFTDGELNSLIVDSDENISVSKGN